MYHIVSDLETMYPSLGDVPIPHVVRPSIPLTAKRGQEDMSTPRVVGAKTIRQCITAIGVLGRFRRCLAANDDAKSYAEELDEAYPVLVLELDDETDWFSPSPDQVPDVELTGEKWCLKPVSVRRAEIKWLGPYSIKLGKNQEVCQRVSFLKGPEGRDHPWLNGKGHPLDCGQMDYEPWPGLDPKRNPGLDMFLFRETQTSLRLPVYAIPDGNAYAVCVPAGLRPGLDCRAPDRFRVPLEKLHRFSGFYDRCGQPLFLNDPVACLDGSRRGIIVDSTVGPILSLYGRPPGIPLHGLPKDANRRLDGVRLDDG